MKVLVVSPYRVPPANFGAGRRIANLVSWIADAGHEIHFVWAPVEPTTRRLDEAQRRLARRWGGATVLPPSIRPERPQGEHWNVDDWVSDEHEEPFRRLVERFRPDVVLVNYVFLSKFLEWAPESSLKYLDTHDRLSRRDIYERAGLDPGFFYTSLEQEMAACKRADVVFAIQDKEAEHFAASGRPVVVVGHWEPANYRTEQPARGTVTVGFAAAHNKFNKVSLDALLAEVKRTNVLARHGAKLLLAGNLIELAKRGGGLDDVPEGVELVGFVDDLRGFYDSLDLVINPTIVGTGLKIKTVEALARGIPLLSTSIGTEGIPIRTPFHACPDIPDLASSLGQILEDPSILVRLANVSRHVHAEYQLNLERNLKALFHPRAGQAAEDHRLAEYIETTTGPLADSDHKGTTLTLGDPALTVGHFVRIAHIVNPVPAGYDSDLYSAQPVTFESMRRAAAFAATQGIDVDLVAVRAGKDEISTPNGFLAAPSAATVVTQRASFRRPRPLPLLDSLLKLGAKASSADWLIYTNADIAVLPHFYTFIAEKIRHGYDALVINRRTVDRERLDISNLNGLYSKIGERHPGFDCFVFRRDLLESFDLGDITVGVHLVGRVLLWNLLTHAKRPLLVDHQHVTFHLGDDNSGKSTGYLDYIEHNTLEAIDVLERLYQKEANKERFDRRLRTFAPNLLNLRFSPAVIKSRERELDPELARRPFFIHALFRTGSTFVWNAFRGSRYHVAYYEPLHEVLTQLDLRRLPEFRKRHTPDAWHTFDGEWLFAEYEPLLTPESIGVPGYRRRFAYEAFADNSEQPQLRAYVEGLLAEAGKKQAVLQMNRSALRQRWFHREYPEGHHIYLARHPREQWLSYLQFMGDRGRGFARNDALICGMNRHRALIKPLNELVPLVHRFDGPDVFQYYDQIFDAYSWEQRYTLFYYLWLQGLLEAAATGSHIVNMNQVAADSFERMRFEAFLGVRGAQLNLAGLRMTSHEDGPLTDQEMHAIEKRVRDLVVVAFGHSRMRKLESMAGSRGVRALIEDW